MFVVAWKDKSGKQVVVNGKPSWHLRWDYRDPGTGKRTYVHETFHGTKRDAGKRWTDRDAEIREKGVSYVKPVSSPWRNTWRLGCATTRTCSASPRRPLHTAS